MIARKQNTKSKPQKQAGSIERSTRERRFIGYSSWTGIPIAVTRTDGEWWLTSPGVALQPLRDYLEADERLIFLCEDGGRVGAVALTQMLATAVEEPVFGVEETLTQIVAGLRRLDVRLDAGDEPVVVELDVFPNAPYPARHGAYSVVCTARSPFYATLFDLDAFETKEDAEEYAFAFFEFLQNAGVDLQIV